MGFIQKIVAQHKDKVNVRNNACDNLIAQVSSNMEKEYFQYNQYGDCVFCMFAFNDNCDIITFYEYDYVNNIIVVKNIYNDTEKVHTRIRYLNLFKYRYGICEVIEN